VWLGVSASSHRFDDPTTSRVVITALGSGVIEKI